MGKKDRRDLEAKGFPAPGRHNYQRVSTRDRTVDYLPLKTPESLQVELLA